jgi:hypothetical protein
MEKAFVIKMKGGFLGSPQYWNGRSFQGNLKKAALYSSEGDLQEEIDTMPEDSIEVFEVEGYMLDLLTRK